MNNTSTRQKVSGLALILLCSLVGATVASLLSLVTTGTASAFLSALFAVYMITGAIGFVRPDPSDVRSLLWALRTSAIWPYLAWKKLEANYQAKQNSNSQYFVVVNGVIAGELSGSDYFAIKLQVMRDLVVYIRQILNLFGIVWTTFRQLLWATPAVVFWFAIAAAVYSPEKLPAIIRSLQDEPDAIQNVVVAFEFLLIMFIPIGFALGFLRPYLFGFRNHFAGAVDQEIRQRCGIAADGDLSVVLCEEVAATA